MMVSINEINICRARLVLGWITVSGLNSQGRTFISPDHPFRGRHNEYQPKGGDALRLGSKVRYGSCRGGR